MDVKPSVRPSTTWWAVECLLNMTSANKQIFSSLSHQEDFAHPKKSSIDIPDVPQRNRKVISNVLLQISGRVYRHWNVRGENCELYLHLSREMSVSFITWIQWQVESALNHERKSQQHKYFPHCVIYCPLNRCSQWLLQASLPSLLFFFVFCCCSLQDDEEIFLLHFYLFSFPQLAAPKKRY